MSRFSTMNLRSLTAAAGVLTVLAAGCGSDSTVPSPVTVVLEPSDRVVVLATEELGDIELLAQEFTAATGTRVDVERVVSSAQLARQLESEAVREWADVVVGLDEFDLPLAAGRLESRAGFGRPRYGDELLDNVGGEMAWPIAHDQVCTVVDLGWFDQVGTPAPDVLGDLVLPEQAGRLVVPRALTSDAGWTFVLHTLEALGDEDWAAYWQDLADNDATVDLNNERVTVGFTGTAGTVAPRPVAVLSMASIPSMPDASLKVLPGSCRRRVQLAAAVASAGDERNAAAIDFLELLLEPESQVRLPGENWPVLGPIAATHHFQGPVEAIAVPIAVEDESSGDPCATGVDDGEDSPAADENEDDGETPTTDPTTDPASEPTGDEECNPETGPEADGETSADGESSDDDEEDSEPAESVANEDLQVERLPDEEIAERRPAITELWDQVMVANATATEPSTGAESSDDEDDS